MTETITNKLPNGRERDLLIALMKECAETSACCCNALLF